ncbi:MAG TPA: hypothetical protein VKV15_04440 [Bryobacteraceae bacterium]|nr:hypothetical protein [Bryobacteraceae bacterium]
MSKIVPAPPVPAPPKVSTTPSPLAISGRLRNALTGYALPGLTVQILLLQPDPVPGAKPLARRLLGSAQSDASGSWNIVWDSSPAASQFVCLLAHCDDAQFVVSVMDRPGSSPLLVTEPASAARAAIMLDLAVPVPVKPLSKAQWTDLGRRVQKAGPVTLNTIVNQLAQTGTAASIFKDWPLAQRQNALLALETGFLDPRGTLGAIAPVPSWQTLVAPDGVDAYSKTLGAAGRRGEPLAALTEMSQKLAAFPSLAGVDWVIDPKLFGRDPAGAITANQEHYLGPNRFKFPVFGDPTPENGLS